jgi:hypothetical protein
MGGSEDDPEPKAQFSGFAKSLSGNIMRDCRVFEA